MKNSDNDRDGNGNDIKDNTANDTENGDNNKNGVK